MLSEQGGIDMNNNTKFQWIDNDTDVSEILKKCPKGLLKTIEEMEQADLAGDVGVLFDNVSDSFDVSTKIMLQNGVITEEERKVLLFKYNCPV